MASTVVVNAASAMRSGGVTIKVRLKGVRRMTARTWLACQVMKLAGMISPVPVEVALTDSGDAENPRFSVISDTPAPPPHTAA